MGALRKGYQRAESHGHVPGGPEVRIRLHSQGCVAGRVLDGTTGLQPGDLVEAEITAADDYDLWAG